LDGTLSGCVAAYQPKGAASYAASKVNLANPGTYNLTEEVGAVSWDTDNGWKGDKTNYFTTGIVPSGQWTVIVRATDLYTTEQNNLVGLYAIADQDSIPGNSRFYIGCAVTGNYWWGYHDKSGTNATASNGVYAVTSEGGYRDGIKIITFSAGALNVGAREIFVLARDYYSGYQITDSNIQAVALYNATLTLTQIGNLTTAMNAL